MLKGGRWIGMVAEYSFATGGCVPKETFTPLTVWMESESRQNHGFLLPDFEKNVLTDSKLIDLNQLKNL